MTTWAKAEQRHSAGEESDSNRDQGNLHLTSMVDRPSRRSVESTETALPAAFGEPGRFGHAQGRSWCDNPWNPAGFC